MVIVIIIAVVGLYFLIESGLAVFEGVLLFIWVEFVDAGLDAAVVGVDVWVGEMGT